MTEQTRPESIQRIMEEMTRRLAHRADLSVLFQHCFPNTLDTTTTVEQDGTTFVLTGDIPAMWLRDSSAQVHQYLPFAKQDEGLRRLFEGLIRRQARYILIDPYANAFNRQPDNAGFPNDRTEQNPWVWERKYEVDSLCAPVCLAWEYWKITASTAAFDETFVRAMHAIVKVWRREQRHEINSDYAFERPDAPDSDSLPFGGRGRPVNFTGMTWSGFRPSDDACRFGYLIPANMHAVVALRHMEEMAESVFEDIALANEARLLADEIDDGIRNYGIYRHPEYGDIYAYETDGYGNYNLMDDANVPSLLSIPYLGYASADNPLYRNTRRFILGNGNPYHHAGRFASGIGSPHTPHGYVWPIALAMQALTSDDPEEIRAMVDMLAATDAGTGFMHESVDPDEPKHYTRSWFAWANSLFSELLLKKIDVL